MRTGDGVIVIPEELLLGLSAALVFAGGVAAATSANGLKRVIGAALALTGAALALAALRVDQDLTIAAAAALFGFAAIGAAIVVRLQESYGAGTVADFDAADRDSEPVERQS